VGYTPLLHILPRGSQQVYMSFYENYPRTNLQKSGSETNKCDQKKLASTQ